MIMKMISFVFVCIYVVVELILQSKNNKLKCFKYYLKNFILNIKK